MTKHEYARSTSQLPLKGFSPHGEANYLYAEDDLLIIRASGPFNREFVEHLEVVETEIIRDMCKQYSRWFALSTIGNSIMLTPDALERYGEFRKTMSESGLAPFAVAFVVAPEVEGRGLILPLVEKLFSQSGTLFREFTHEEEARDWLSQTKLG